MSNRWCFTYNNAPEGWEPAEGSEVAYMTWQRERGEEGTEHIQGYVRFKTKKRMKTVKRWFDVNEMHLEPARGSEKDNKEYCNKSNTRIDGPWEYGVYDKDVGGKQGKRSDLEEIANKLTEGASIKKIAEEHASSYIKFHQGIEKLRDIVQPMPPMEREVTTTVLWGRTNTGKTHRARTQLPEIYDVKPGRDPWGNYVGQDSILFDEFDYNRWTIQEMNMFCDKWRCQLDCRYKDKYAEWKKVVICANSDPQTWWPGTNMMLKEAFWRRLNIIEVLNREQEIKI